MDKSNPVLEAYMQASAEEASAAVKDTARLYAQMYHELIEQGVPEEAAVHMTCAFMHDVMSASVTSREFEKLMRQMME